MPQASLSTALPLWAASPYPSSPEEPAATDLDLLREIAAGSGEALGLFYDRHASMALGLLCRILGDRNEAEEVLQEAFLQVWRDARRYDPDRSSPRGWLLLIARSRALDRHRATVSRRRREDEAAHTAAVLAVAPLGTRRLEHGESRRRIGSALDRLPPEQRRVIELSFYEGLTQTQIAEALNAPLGTVKSRALMAMRKLREMLREPEMLGA
jgi:RNA polymerase sigma-70 factor (ECF subfamily)